MAALLNPTTSLLPFVLEDCAFHPTTAETIPGSLLQLSPIVLYPPRPDTLNPLIGHFHHIYGILFLFSKLVNWFIVYLGCTEPSPLLKKKRKRSKTFQLFI